MARKRAVPAASKRGRGKFSGWITLEGVVVILSGRHFSAEPEARAWLEKQRWPKRVICPHCTERKVYRLTSKPGYFRCAKRSCRQDFTVTTGTVMERSHVPLHKWLVGLYLMSCGYKLRVSELCWAMGVTYPTAKVLHRRIGNIQYRAMEQLWERELPPRGKDPFYANVPKIADPTLKGVVPFEPGDEVPQEPVYSPLLRRWLR